MRDDRERLLDIREAIEQIQKYSGKGRKTFETDELVQSWIVRHLQILGEAARALSPALKERYPDVPWSEIVGMRNILVHDYFGMDADLVWSVVVRDLPALKPRIETMLADLGS